MEGETGGRKFTYVYDTKLLYHIYVQTIKIPVNLVNLLYNYVDTESVFLFFTMIFRLYGVYRSVTPRKIKIPTRTGTSMCQVQTRRAHRTQKRRRPHTAHRGYDPTKSRVTLQKEVGSYIYPIAAHYPPPPPWYEVYTSKYVFFSRRVIRSKYTNFKHYYVRVYYY